MSVLVVGSVAYDSVETSFGIRQDALGGSATYFSMSGGYFTPVSMVGVVGDDFRPEDFKLLESRNIDTSGLVRSSGKTFRWSGTYSDRDVNVRRTLNTQLNVFAHFSPVLSYEHSQSEYVFLANIDPDLQRKVLEQMKGRPRFVALDTMNYWIEEKHIELKDVLRDVDAIFVDEGEARDLANETNLIKCADRIKELGPEIVVVKRGEHGAIMFHGESVFSVPGVPLEDVVDPTGAGDCFAGGFLGYLAATDDLSPMALRRAAVLGSVMGSFAVESFSVDRIRALAYHDIDTRFREVTKMAHFEPLGISEILPWEGDL